MRSATQHTFARIPSVEIPRSSFKREMTYKTTFNAGRLIPFYLDEILPGDTFNFKLSSFARILSPLKYPIMDNLYMDFQFFFVPIRLVYADYEKFFGSSKGQEGNWEYDDSHVLPQITIPVEGENIHSIFDYFGIPYGVGNFKVNALPFRCYNKIVNDWYLPSVYELPGPTLKVDSTDDLPSLYTIQKRIKRADYFTSSLIAPQRGPGATVGLVDSAPVIGTEQGIKLRNTLTSSANEVFLVGGTSTSKAVSGAANPSSGRVGTTITSPTAPNPANTVLGLATENSGLIADLSSASSISINSLRQAFQLQRALERDMRGGVQYVNQILAHFGVRSPDARLQRSEYLGGGSVPINVHTVANTTGTDEAAQGSLSGFGVSGQSGIGWIKSFTEHGYVIGIVSVRADLTYQQGLPRLFDRKTRFDFYYPVFSHLGEQAVLNKEIYCQSDSVVDDTGTPVNEGVFGYQERFGEYRYGVSKITGELRSTYAQSLDSWHLSQKFNNLPTLNETFLRENVPMSRVKADIDAPDFLFDALISCNCVRPMPLFGVPGLVDHF